MSTTKRRMPTERAIRAYWADRLWRAKGYDSAAEFMEPGSCFACGLCNGAERAHIVARVAGGTDEAENLHMLCPVCHKDSEYLEGERYMAWLMQRSPVDVWLSSSTRRGFNPAAWMQAYAAKEVAVERARLRAALMAMHERDKHRHNYWHCAARELFGE